MAPDKVSGTDDEGDWRDFAMSRRRLLESGVAMSSALALSGCIDDLFGGGGEETSITITQQVEPLEWDPVVINDVYSQQIAINIYDGLYEYDDDLSLVPRIAEDDPEVERDGTRFIFPIKEGVTFHNGDELTAEDVEHTFLAPVEDETENADEVNMISDTEIIDDHTLQVDLEFPYGQFTTATMARSVVNKEVRLEDREAYNLEEPIGTGPYEFVDWEQGDFVEIQVNEDYWNEDEMGLPNIDTVVYEPVDEDTTRITRLQEESSEIIMGIPAQLWEDVEEMDHAYIEATESISYFYLAFNCNEGPTATKEVREAIDYVFDMDQFIEEQLEPAGVRARATLPPGIAETWELPVEEWNDEYSYDVDYDQAEALLDEHAPDDWEPLIIVPPDDLRELLGEVVQSGLEEIGYNATVQRIDWGPFTDRYQSGDADEFNMYALGWAGAGDPDAFMYPLFHEDNAGTNQGHFYDNQEVHDAILTARESTDYDERRGLYIEAIEQILADKVHLPAYSTQNSMGILNELEDIQAHPASQWNPRIFSHYNNATL
ncbi:MAG: ABC transporter substrate-binding protein [Halobacteriales archaeon]